jgi:hypothetical protein
VLERVRLRKFRIVFPLRKRKKKRPKGNGYRPFMTWKLPCVFDSLWRLLLDSDLFLLVIGSYRFVLQDWGSDLGDGTYLEGLVDGRD